MFLHSAKLRQSLRKQGREVADRGQRSGTQGTQLPGRLHRTTAPVCINAPRCRQERSTCTACMVGHSYCPSIVYDTCAASTCNTTATKCPSLDCSTCTASICSAGKTECPCLWCSICTVGKCGDTDTGCECLWCSTCTALKCGDTDTGSR